VSSPLEHSIPSWRSTECRNGRRVRARACFGVAFVTLALLTWHPALAQGPNEVRRVLVFNDFSPVASPGIGLIDQAIGAGLEKSGYQIELYTETLESTLFPDEQSQRRIREWFISKYKNRKPDVIIVVGPGSLRFIIESHETAFANIPVIFCGSTQEMLGELQPNSSFTGVWGVAQPDKTLAAALRLLPKTKHVVVVAGVGKYDRYLEAIAKQQFRQYESRFEFTYLTDLDKSDLIERLKHLPENTIVYHTAITQDASGAHFIDATQSVPMVAEAANAPVFVVDDVDLGSGAVGGDLLSLATEGQTAAEMAVKVLNGAKAQDIPIVKSANAYMFDSRALKRWGLKEVNLPPESIVLNRQPSVWESYKSYIIGGISLILLEALLIVALLRQQKMRRRAEEILRQSEERFRLVANSAPALIWMAGPDQLCTYVNQPWLEFTGRKVEEEIGNGWADGIHTDDLENALATYAEAFHQRQPFTMEYRLRRHDGEYRWVLDTGAPIINPDGSFSGYIGSAIDVTERKLAEEALASIGGKLIAAQEAERTRIARELHDDINQQMAFLAISLDQMRNSPPGSVPEIRSRTEALFRKTEEISRSLQALSHKLHSSKLEYFGLVNAMQGFCREFSDQHHVEVQFSEEYVPQHVPKEISLCLFRVMQAGLTNALKHSGVDRFEVRVHGTTYGIHLTIHDDGVGFDPDKALKSDGIGIISMRERVRFVNGTLAIESKANGGTTIGVDVPLAPAMATSQTA